MTRFTMPDTSLPINEQRELLREQFNDFIDCDAIKDILSILNTDIQEIKTSYNGRTLPNGKIREVMEFNDDNRLEKFRYELYSPLYELGLFDINKPLSDNHSHIIVLGGSLSSTYNRTNYALNQISKGTQYIDGLACYRPISPKERHGIFKDKKDDTEFFAMSEAFEQTFDLQNYNPIDDFVSDRNINSISNIRTFSNDNNSKNDITYRILAAPSTEPDLRRADTSDTINFYINNSRLNENSSILAITDNRYCNRQFIQIATEMLNSNVSYNLDIIGCFSGKQITTKDNYNPYLYIQDVIALINLIEKFDRT